MICLPCDDRLKKAKGLLKENINNNEEISDFIFDHFRSLRFDCVPIDRKTTDEERAKYGVLPLAELLKRYPEQVKKTP